jgi:hypothetical protein
VKKVQVFAVLLMLFLVQVCIAQEIALQVAIIAKEVPDQLLMQEEEGIQGIAFQYRTDGSYWGKVARPKPADLANAKKLSLDYRLVASWVDGKEQLFLKIQSQLPELIVLKLYHNQDAFNDVALDKIDGLGTDLDSLIEKYCRARAFHMHWRFEKKQPENFIALRSARMWFDAAVALATRGPISPFRMDSDIMKIMNDYEAMARHDNRFNSRYRKYALSGYVQGMLVNVKTAEYDFVGLVPKLVSEGKHQEAYELNSKAYSVLSGESKSTRKLVEKRQGVNLELLRSNAAFLVTKAGR